MSLRQVQVDIVGLQQTCGQIGQLFNNGQLAPNEAYLNMINFLSVSFYPVYDSEQKEEIVMKCFKDSKVSDGLVYILKKAWACSSLWISDSTQTEYKCFVATFAFIQNMAWYFRSASCFLVDAGMIGILITMLIAHNPSHFKAVTSKVEDDIVLMTAATSQNMAYYEEIRGDFIKSGFVEFLIPHLETPRIYVKTSVIICLSYLVNKTQSEIFKADITHLMYIITLLKTSLQSVDGTAEGWSSFRLVKGLSTLASNDSNKRNIVHADALPCLDAMMKRGNYQEKKVALHTILVLSSDKVNKEKINQNNDVMKALTDIATNSSDKEMKKMANSFFAPHAFPIQGALDDVLLDKIGNKIGKNLNSLVVHLGQSDKIDNIKASDPHIAGNWGFQVLKSWLQGTDVPNHKEALVKTLRDIGRVDLAKEVGEYTP